MHERTYFVARPMLAVSSGCAAILSYSLLRDAIHFGIPGGKVVAFCGLSVFALMFVSMATYRIAVYNSHWSLKYLFFTLAKVTYKDTYVINHWSYRFFRGYSILRASGNGSRSFSCSDLGMNVNSLRQS
jgi:hypothetical protein